MYERIHDDVAPRERDPVPNDNPDHITKGGPVLATETQGKSLWRAVRLGIMVVAVIVVLVFIFG